ncbi:MAG: hypothetical protein ACM3X1_04610 [Ignavibacteriales bacterium]
MKLFCRAIRIFHFLLPTWEKHFLFVVDPILSIEASRVNGTRKKIANCLAKLNYNLKFLYLTVIKVALNVDIHRMRCFPTRGSINVLITAIVVAAIISLHSVSPGYVSIVYAVQGSSLTSYPSSMNAISPYSVGQSNQLYQTPLLTLGTNLEESSEQDSSETASISSVSTAAPSSPPSPPTSTTSSSPPSTGTNQATTTTSSTETPSTTPQTPGAAEVPSAPLTTSPSPTTTQQQLSSIYQQPAVPQTSSAIQQLPAQPLIQATPQTQSLLQNNPAQPYGIPSTSATIQPQLSALPPTATTFPPSVFPPVNSLQPYGTLGSTGSFGYPSTVTGQYGLGGAGAAAATSVGASSQLISPWFPSLPASYCGGTFLLTIEGTPRSNGDDKKIEPSDKNDNNHDNNGDDNNHDGNNHKHSKDSDRDKRLLSLQINSDNTRIFTDDDQISGEIFLGKNNIDKNKGNDFDIKSIFNDCQVITYSKF